MEDTRRRALIVGGIVLLGAGAGLAGYLYYKSRQPDAYIESARAEKVGEKVFVTATVRNNGKKPGYFKIQSILAATDCPAGKTGRLPSDKDPTWTNILNCVATRNAAGQFAGSWCGIPTGGWQLINPGSSATLRVESWQTQQGYRFPSGTYNLYVNAAVSTNATGSPRLYDREYYLWVSGVRI
jgi:hypothetical protein